jgi:DNA-binding winged helix-turn-helix (wHTH) protein
VLTKELLTERLWGQSYKPLRHDNLIYGLIARVRKLLGRCSWWIEVSEQGYSLHQNVSIKIWRQANPQVTVAVSTFESGQNGANLNEPTQISSTNESNLIHSKFSKMLNLRQIKILEWSFTRQNIQPRELMDEFKISDATVTRDLTKMVEISAFERHGQGRATYYTVRRDFSVTHQL